MERIFLEEKEEDIYRIACVNHTQVFLDEGENLIGEIYECMWKNLSLEDRSQIFYALAPEIKADDWKMDLKSKFRSARLNTWSIKIKDPNNPNFFDTIQPLTLEDRIILYSKSHSISPENSIEVDTSSLFALIALSDHNSWKNGILQRCIDCLVKPKFRENAEIYAHIDINFRFLYRFLLETQRPDSDPLLMLIHQMLTELKLENSLDSSHFHISDTTEDYLTQIRSHIPLLIEGETVKVLSNFFRIWNGATLISTCQGFQIKSNLISLLNYLDSLPPVPDRLRIISR